MSYPKAQIGCHMVPLDKLETLAREFLSNGLKCERCDGSGLVDFEGRKVRCLCCDGGGWHAPSPEPGENTVVLHKSPKRWTGMRNLL